MSLASCGAHDGLFMGRDSARPTTGHALDIEEADMTGLPVVLTTWLVVGGMVALWLADAVWLAEAPHGHRPDPTACACCRHDRVAHASDQPGSTCTQCPCTGFRRRDSGGLRPRGRRGSPPLPRR